jgi:hypothetical protein
MDYMFVIQDSASKPIPGGYARFVDPAGNRITDIAANSQGVVQINPDTDSGLFGAGNGIVFMAPGYAPYGLSADTIPQTFYVTLAKKPNTDIALAIGAVAAIAIATGKGNKLIGKVESEVKKTGKGVPKWVWPAAGIGVGGFILYKLLTKPDAKAADSAILATQAGNQIDVLKSQGQVTAYTTAELEAFCSTLVQASEDCFTDDTAIENVFYQMYTDADIWALIKQFGVRNVHACFTGNWFGDTPYNLPQLITDKLGASERQKINDILVQHQISYQF